MDTLVGPYQIRASLGQGGMGVVYHAEHSRTGQPVALKTVKLPNAALLGSLLLEVGDKLELGKLLCLRGHLALARAAQVNGLLAQAGALAQETGAGPESELGKGLLRLSRAREVFEAGAHQLLFRGERLVDIPAPVRHWLVEHDRLPRKADSRF
jgi:hypothetical protein